MDKPIFYQLSSVDSLIKKLQTQDFYLEKKTLVKLENPSQEYISQPFLINGVKAEIRSYPFLGSFLVIGPKGLDKLSMELKIPKKKFNHYSIKQTVKTAEQWLHRGLELTFKQVKTLSSPKRALRYNKKRYGVESAFMFTSVDFEINSDCNRKCPYCPNSILERKHKGLMDDKLFKKIIRELWEMDYNHYIHYSFNNEPLLHPRLESLIAYVTKKVPQARNRLFTNGDFLTLDKFRSLIKAGVDYFIVTLHGSKKRRLPEHIEHLISNCSAEEKIKIDIQYPPYKYLNNRAGLVDYGFPPEKTRRLPCFRPAFKIVIAVNGFVLACDNDYLEKMVLGDLNYQSLKEIWTGSKYVKFRHDLMKGLREPYKLCRECNKKNHGSVALFGSPVENIKVGHYTTYLELE